MTTFLFLLFHDKEDLTTRLDLSPIGAHFHQIYNRSLRWSMHIHAFNNNSLAP